MMLLILEMFANVESCSTSPLNCILYIVIKHTIKLVSYRLVALNFIACVAYSYSKLSLNEVTHSPLFFN